MTVHSRSPALTSRNHTSPHIFIVRHLDHDAHPGCLFRQLYLSPQPRYKPSDCSVLFPTPLAINRCHPIIGSHHGLLLRNPKPTETWNQLFVPPPHCSKPSLHEQPPFLLAVLSNNWKKQPRLLGGQKVSICFVICIFVCKKLYWIHQPHLQPLFHTGEWSKPTHNPPNLSCLIQGVGGWGR